MANRWVTHGVTAVAELKPPEFLLPDHWAAVTHGVTAVAELKPTRARHRAHDGDSHPRRHRRGRIEAIGR